MAVLTAVPSGRGLSAGALATTAGRLVAFLVGLVVVGLLVVPAGDAGGRAARPAGDDARRERRAVLRRRPCWRSAFGYSVALGAFLAGSLVAESGEAQTIERLVRPVRDVFAAVFFVSVGMLIDPALVVRHWRRGARAHAGRGRRQDRSASRWAPSSPATACAPRSGRGMSLAQIGEFSFIIAGLGLSLGATRDFLYPVAVAVSALTTLLTPWLIRASGPAANFVDRQLPRPLQTFAALYASWLEELREGARRPTLGAELRRRVRLLVLDAALLAVLLIVTSLFIDRVVASLVLRFEVSPGHARAAVLAGVALVALPFCAGIVGLARRLGSLLADAALPPKEAATLDRAAAPRRALVVTLQLAMVLLVGAPLLAVTQPFLPALPGPLMLAALTLALGVAFWRSATNLEGHVRAGAEMILQVLVSQARGKGPPRSDALLQVQKLLPGLGAPTPLRLEGDSRAVGKTLAELNLRGLTGATVLAIIRDDEGVLIPSATERLRAGDVLALAGTHDAVAAAAGLLASGPTMIGTDIGA